MARSFGICGFAFIVALVVSANDRQVKQRAVKCHAVVRAGFFQLFDRVAITEPFVSHFRRVGFGRHVHYGRLAFDDIHAVIGRLGEMRFVY